jgi:hypothetical protein
MYKIPDLQESHLTHRLPDGLRGKPLPDKDSGLNFALPPNFLFLPIPGHSIAYFKIFMRIVAKIGIFSIKKEADVTNRLFSGL